MRKHGFIPVIDLYFDNAVKSRGFVKDDVINKAGRRVHFPDNLMVKPAIRRIGELTEKSGLFPQIGGIK